jgi:hypothetical protein
MILDHIIKKSEHTHDGNRILMGLSVIPICIFFLILLFLPYSNYSDGVGRCYGVLFLGAALFIIILAFILKVLNTEKRQDFQKRAYYYSIDPYSLPGFDRHLWNKNREMRKYNGWLLFAVIYWIFINGAEFYPLILI